MCWQLYCDSSFQKFRKPLLYSLSRLDMSDNDKVPQPAHVVL